jgi:hypothetical protein
MVDAVGALLLLTTAGVEEMVMRGCGTTKPFYPKMVRLVLQDILFCQREEHNNVSGPIPS